MSSEARIKASRENGKKGGVKTDAGRARSCMNALKHGYYSHKAPILCTEDEGKFADFREQLIARFQPADQAEAALVDKIAATMWRIDRYECAQEYFIDFEINLQLDELEKDNEGVDIDPDLRMSLALHHCLSSKDSALVEHSRYTTRFYRKQHRLFVDLAMLQGPRFHSGPKPQPQPEPQPEPDDQPPPPQTAPQSQTAAPEPAEVKKSENEPRSLVESVPQKLPTLPALSRTPLVFSPKSPRRIENPEKEAPLKAMTA